MDFRFAFVIAMAVFLLLVAIKKRTKKCACQSGAEGNQGSDRQTPASDSKEKKTFTLGSTREHVLAVLGTPENIGENGAIWEYRLGWVHFRGNTVSEVKLFGSAHAMRFEIDPKTILLER